MGIDDDPYAAYCLDEACAYVRERMLRGDTPRQTGGNEAVIARMKRANQRYKEVMRHGH